MRCIFTLLLLLNGLGAIKAQAPSDHPHSHRHIEFPDLPDFLTIVCDLHQHTVFSDGNVWPTIRVEEALMNGRTAVWFNNTLIGKEENIVPLLHSCLSVREAAYQTNSTVANVIIENRSDADFILENLSPYTLHRHANLVTAKAHETTTLEIKTIDLKDSFNLKFRVRNAVIAPNAHPVITLPITTN